MGRLANAFSVLNIDGEDDLEEITSPATANSTSTAAKAAKRNMRKRDAGKGDGCILLFLSSLVVSIIGCVPCADKCKERDESAENGEVVVEFVTTENPSLLTEQLKLPLVWIDLEMTGLNLEVDRILEIACIITDGSLTKSVEGPNLVIHQTKDCMDKMGEWCREHHGASGLTKRVLQSNITEAAAEEQVIEFVRKHVGTYTPLLAGNSIHVDYAFLKKYMPKFACLFGHVLVDVSSVKSLCIRWFPGDYKKVPAKANNHRALDDIKESIQELRYYKENIFKSRTKK